MNALKIALAPFLRECSAVETLGVRACLDDYSQEEKRLLQKAERIFFPTPRFSDIFQALERPTFPNPTTYRYQRSRVLQQILFQYLKLPQPSSRIYFGTRNKQVILQDFRFPLLVLGAQVVPGASSETAQLVENREALQESLDRYNPVIIRQVVEWSQRIQLVCVQYECIGALRSVPGQPCPVFPEPFPTEHHSLREPLGATLHLIRAARLDDILVQWGYGDGRWQLIELARPPVHWNGTQGRLNRYQHIGGLIEAGVL